MANIFDENASEGDLGYIYRVSGPCKLLGRYVYCSS